MTDFKEVTYKISMWSEAEKSWITHVRVAYDMADKLEIYHFLSDMEGRGHEVKIEEVD